jgi:hypothetical protein
MLGFKKFSEFKRTKEGHIILDEPIHFKDGKLSQVKTKDGYIILDEPIHFKDGKLSFRKNEVKEETEGKPAEHELDHVQTAEQDNLNKHGSHLDLSNKLHDATMKNISIRDHKNLEKFTDQDKYDPAYNGSYRLNKALIAGKLKDEEHRDMHDSIMNNAKPSGHEFHLFSGVSRNYGAIAKKSKNHIVHAPAHTSATHSLVTAREFSHNKASAAMASGDKPGTLGLPKENHMIHIHVKPHDKILHISRISAYEDEHETVIPAGTNLKYSHSSKHNHNGKEYNVHHFTIHSQK